MKKFFIPALLFLTALYALLLYFPRHAVDIPVPAPDTLSLKTTQATYELIPTPDSISIITEHKQYTLSFGNRQVLVDIAVCDLDQDDNEEMLVLLGDSSKEYADDLVIYTLQNEVDGLRSDEFPSGEFPPDGSPFSLKEIYRNTLTPINPWAIDTCDIDGDGEPEIFIGVNKGTEYYPEQANRPFFFNFRDNMLVKKWTGSKLRHPFTQISFADINDNGSDELIVIEQIDERTSVISVYYWFGFGFTLLAESSVYEQIDSAKVVINAGKWHIEAEVVTNKTQKSLKLVPSTKRTADNIYRLEEH